MKPCALCQAATTRPLRWEGDAVVAFNDHYPSATGHVLVVPRRHVARLAELLTTERDEMWGAAMTLIDDLSRDHSSSGFTVGVNDGSAAGQTVPHVHLHVIPRTDGDTANPRGGIRWAIPETADYWTAAS